MSAKCTITPVANYTSNGGFVYGQPFDASEYVQDGGLGQISVGIDSQDYDFGAYSFGDVTISLINTTGLFNNPFPFADGRTIFREIGRDKAKVSLEFNGGAVFNGLISDEFSRQDLNSGIVQVRVTSLDSILRKTAVVGGVVNSGMLISTAINNIMTRPPVAAVLGFNPASTVLLQDVTIDNATDFAGQTAKEALELLLLAGGGVLTVNAAGTARVRTRAPNSNAPHAFFGDYDALERSNIMAIGEMRDGLNRAFNQLNIDKQVVQANGHITRWGLRKKDLSALKNIFTDEEKRQRIMNALLLEFREPKREFDITIRTAAAAGVNILDRVSVKAPLRAEGQTYYDAATYDGGTPYAKEYSGFSLVDGLALKVFEMQHSLESQQTTLKLRQI
jgi:hypothetical protein